MGGKRKARCPHGTCTWVPLRGGKTEQCTTCGDVFPCRHACGHYDCAEARGEPSPLDKYNPDKHQDAIAPTEPR